MAQKTSDYTKRGRPLGGRITEDTPLKPFDKAFIQHYMETGKATLAYRQACEDFGKVHKSEQGYREGARREWNYPNVQREIEEIWDASFDDNVASAREMMIFFTNVMRGLVPDQFGLDATLTDRMAAGRELMKHFTESKELEVRGSGNEIHVTLDWGRDQEGGAETDDNGH
jgi:phage terminase small subunit